MKIGIITHYLNSKNYGGLLQAYALCEFLNQKMPGSTEQIAYSLDATNGKCYKRTVGLKEKLSEKTVGELFSIPYKRIKRRQALKNQNLIQDRLSLRKEKFKEFEMSIPHTKKIIFDGKNIDRCNELYDAFITGSDQVWAPREWKEAFFLEFVKDNKPKISYAASMAVRKLNTSQKKQLLPLIERFDAISVREKAAQKMLTEYLPNKIDVVVDPVFLLDANQWKKICEKPKIEETYGFAYLLGDRVENRIYCEKVAKQLGLKIATVPYVHLRYNEYDGEFGDIHRDDTAPPEFLGLIRDSEMVFTDSFHAVAFSILFQKKFIAFRRTGKKSGQSGDSRITDLLNLCGLSERFIEKEEEITEEFLNKEIDFTYAHKVLKEKKLESTMFLAKAFQGTEMEEKLKEEGQNHV